MLTSTRPLASAGPSIQAPSGDRAAREGGSRAPGLSWPSSPYAPAIVRARRRLAASIYHGVFCIHFARRGQVHAPSFIDFDSLPPLHGHALSIQLHAADDHMLLGEFATAAAPIEPLADTSAGHPAACWLLLPGGDRAAEAAALASAATLLDHHRATLDHPASLLAAFQERPLLATFAVCSSLDPLRARASHRLLLARLLHFASHLSPSRASWAPAELQA